jgi:hypothetical protein
MEDSVYEVKEMEGEFYRRRTTVRNKRLPIETLPGYKDDEKFRPDKFWNGYVGKDYGGRAYEINSMGMEWLMGDESELFAKKDPDHQHLILGMLALMRRRIQWPV